MGNDFNDVIGIFPPSHIISSAPANNSITEWDNTNDCPVLSPPILLYIYLLLYSIVLGLTVLSLTGGLISLLKNDRKQSQMMMRARVFFQFGAVSSLVGGIYYRAYTGTLTQKSGKPSTDKRVYLTDPMPALQKDTTGVIISSSSSSEKSPKLR